jgi:hypothetical protein
MIRYYLRIQWFSVLVGALAMTLIAAGCGGGGGGSGEITVQTGSLSKAEFIKRADAICSAARTEFLAEYTSFYKANESALEDAQKEPAVMKEALETIVTPNYDGEIEKISALGAPSDYAPKVTAFLKSVQRRLDEVHEHPAELLATPYPFKEPEDVAKAAGLQGCAESFS